MKIHMSLHQYKGAIALFENPLTLNGIIRNLSQKDEERGRGRHLLLNQISLDLIH